MSPLSANCRSAGKDKTATIGSVIRYTACSTIWNSIPNVIMPIAAAAIGRRMMIAASALLSGPCSLSKSPRTQSWSDGGWLVFYSLPALPG